MRSNVWVLLVVGCGSVSSNKPDAAVVDSPVADVAVDTAGDAATCVASPAMLRAQYRAEGNATDHTGTYDGTAEGANFTYSTGKYGQAFQFDGTDDTVSINDLEALWPSGSFSLEAWIKTTSSPNPSNTIVCKYGCGNTCPASNALAYFCMYLTNGGKASFDFRPNTPAAGSSDTSTVTATQVNVTDGNWHHLVAVRDSTALTQSLYIDGALAVSAMPAAAQFGPMSNLDSDNDLVTIGAAVVGGMDTYENRFAGAIEEVAIYHSALSAAEVAAIYAAPNGKCL